MTEALTLERFRPRLRERALVSGVDTLSEAELLAVVLGTGTPGESASAVAVSLLDSLGGLTQMLRLGPHALAERRGVGPVKAMRIVAAFELGRRALHGSLTEPCELIDGFDAVAAWARGRLATLDHEEVWMLMLDGRNGLRSARRVAQGGLHGCALTPRDLLGPALRDAASAIVVIHNHPSGDPEPSPEDVAMTRAVAAACDVVGVPLLDHVVVAKGGATSLLERGALDP